MIAALVLLLSQTSYVPPEWKDLPKRIDYLMSQLAFRDPVGPGDGAAYHPETDNAKRELMVIGKPAIPALMKALQSTDDPSFAHATEILAKIGAKEAIPILVAKLRERPITSRQIIAAYYLGFYRDPTTRLDLLRLVDERQAESGAPAQAALCAADALARLHNPADAPKLAAMLRSEDWAVHIEQAESLGDRMIQVLQDFGPGCRDAVWTLLNDKSIDVQRRAVLVLGKLGDRTVKPALFKFFGFRDADILRDLVEPSDLAFLVPLINVRGKMGPAAVVLAGLPFHAGGKYILGFLENAELSLGAGYKFQDHLYAKELETCIAKQTGDRQFEIIDILAQQGFPESLEFMKAFVRQHSDEFSSREDWMGRGAKNSAYGSAIDYLAKIDPQFLLDMTRRKKDWTADFSLSHNKVDGFRSYLLQRPKGYDEDEILVWLKGYGDSADEGLFLHHLSDKNRDVALRGLLKIRGIEPN